MFNADNDIDDLGYSNPNRFICTDPRCDGVACPGENHISPEQLSQQDL